MSFKIIQVGVARFGQELRISAPDVSLEAGDAVQWLVTGVAREETLLLLAESLTDPNHLGPFTFVRVERGILSAHGTSGITGASTYRLLLMRPGAAGEAPQVVAESAPARLEVAVSRLPVERSGQVVLVTLAPEGESADPGQLSLAVSPLVTRLIGGDPLIFEFRLPETLFGNQTWIPSIVFDGDEEKKPERAGGPFAGLAVVAGPLETAPLGPLRTLGRKVAEDEGRVPLVRRFLIASGSNGMIGRFGYRAIARAADGTQIVSSPDPVVDNDGEIVCPGC